MSDLGLSWIRAQFPSLSQSLESLQIHPHPQDIGSSHSSLDSTSVAFLDGPGGTQIPATVLEAMQNYLIQANANAHGAFITSAKTDALMAEARSATADFLGCDPDEIVFGPNMTSLTFMLSRSLGRSLRPGDEIIVTQLDHDANIAPWEALQEKGVIIRYVDIQTADCTLDLNHLKQLLNEHTCLVAVGYASNAVGTINDVSEIVQLAHAYGAVVFVDAVHYAPHGVIDVRELDCDFLVCSAYKFFGPHVGILYGKRQHLTSLRPYKVAPAPEVGPARWETGTPNFEGIAGVVATLQYIESLGHRVSRDITTRREAMIAAMSAIQSYEQQLSATLVKGLLEIPGLTFYGIRDRDQLHRRTPTVSIRLAGMSPEDVARQLGDRGIFTWHGNFYAQKLTTRLGVEKTGGLLRIGMVHYNTLSEVQRMLQALHEIAVQPALSSS